MPKRPTISHEARVTVILALRAYQHEHPDGCTLTRLNQRLGWRTKETTKTINDLVQSGMVYGDYLTPWVLTHPNPKHRLFKSGGYLLKVSPWGDEFLKHWEELNKLGTARDHHYSELEYDLEQEEKRSAS
ncbi:MAG: hypothetical protein HY296_04860 [Thaumarchaeota archaeon]|nr:hypothetical protein [Nitrososphaerota archaeon]